MQPHRTKQYREFQEEAYVTNKSITKAEVVARKKAKRRHTLLRIIAGSAAGVRSCHVRQVAVRGAAADLCRVGLQGGGYTRQRTNRRGP